MVLKNKPLDEMLEEIGFTHLGMYEIIIPGKNGSITIMCPHYQLVRPTEMFYDEIDEILKQEVGGDKIDNWSGFIEAVGNAFSRGNQESTYLPVSFKIFYGKKGVVIRIRDSGKGFPYKEKIKQKNLGLEYFQNTGGGLRDQDNSRHIFSYEGDGSIINILMLKTKALNNTN